MVNALSGLGGFSPLAAMDYVQQQGEVGRQRGINSQLNQLASLASTAPRDQQQSLVSQAYGIDRTGGAQIQQQVQSQEDRRNTVMGNMARLLVSSPEQARPALYQRMLPDLTSFGIPDLPGAYDDASKDLIMGSANAIVQALGAGAGGASGVQSTYVNANGQRVAIMRDGSTQILGDNDPGVTGQTLTIDVNGVPTQVTFDKRTQRYTTATLDAPAAPFPAPPQPPTRSDMEADIGLANELIAAGIPEAQVDAFLAQRGQRAAVAPAPAQAASVPLVGRTKEAEAAAVEQARTDVQMGALPDRIRMENEGAIDRAAGIARVEAEAKDAAQRPKKIQGYQQALAAAGNVQQSIDRALGLISPVSTGFGGARLRSVEGSDAFNLAAELETIKANLGFDRLQQMRDSSPTGGALGAIAVQELVALQSTIANLDPNQSEDQIRANLQRVATHYANWRKAVQQAIADEQRAAQAPAASRQSPSAPAQGGASDYSNLWN